MSILFSFLSRRLQIIWKYVTNLSEFFMAIGGFLILQLAAWALARLASEHGLLGDLMCRLIFFVIQGLLFLIFENKVHFFQYKQIWILFANSILVLLSTQINPIYSFIGFNIIAYPSFKRQTEEYKEYIDAAIEEDEAMWFIVNKKKKPEHEKELRNYKMIGKSREQMTSSDEDEEPK